MPDDHDTVLVTTPALTATQNPTRLDIATVDELAGSFPNGRWQRFNARKDLAVEASPSRVRTWIPLAHLNGSGGNYAFLFPRDVFAVEREVALDSTNGRSIPFIFSCAHMLDVGGYVVAYVGKASNLLQRFQLHFRSTENTMAAQVRQGLVKSGLAATRDEAIAYMNDLAVVVFVELPGDENAANRDLLEMKLCARFAPVFNIKAER